VGKKFAEFLPALALGLFPLIGSKEQAKVISEPAVNRVLEIDLQHFGRRFSLWGRT